MLQVAVALPSSGEGVETLQDEGERQRAGGQRDVDKEDWVQARVQVHAMRGSERGDGQLVMLWCPGLKPDIVDARHLTLDTEVVLGPW
jgi:hypothetical protein